MKKRLSRLSILLIGLCVFTTLMWFHYNLSEVEGATIIRSVRLLTFASVDATPLDGTSAGRTFQASDRNNSQCLKLSERCDAVIITIYSNGAANDTHLFNLYLYGSTGPALPTYDNVTGTVGTAVAGSGLLYTDTLSGIDLHMSTISIKDSSNNRVVKIGLDTIGAQWIKIEPQTFGGTITTVTFEIREYGYRYK